MGLAAAAAAIWHFVWLKPYSVTPTELQARYAYKEELTPGDAHSVDYASAKLRWRAVRTAASSIPATRHRRPGPFRC
jgi:hypothetical protein